MVWLTGNPGRAWVGAGGGCFKCGVILPGCWGWGEGGGRRIGELGPGRWGSPSV